jgi:hypothetical protein
MGPDGKPKLGPNGEALEIVDGLAVRADGVVLGNDGLPMLDEFGNPIRYINGQFVRSDGTVVNADGSVKLGEDGQPLKAEYIVKPCSNDKGELLGLDGKVILGKNGQPLKEKKQNIEMFLIYEIYFVGLLNTFGQNSDESFVKLYTIKAYLQILLYFFLYSF